MDTDGSRGEPRFDPLFLVIAGLLVASIGVIYWTGVRAVEANRKLSVQRSAIEHVGQALSTLTDAETGQRGYLLSGVESDLEPYRAALAAVRAQQAALDELVAAHELPSDAVARVHELSGQKLAELDATIKARRERGLEAAVAILNSGPSERIMGELRAVVDGMKAAKETEFAETSRFAEQSNTRRTAVFVATAIVTLAFLAWACWRIVTEMRRRETAVLETGRQKDLLATTLAGIGDGVVITDHEARITSLNRVAATLTGWSAAEAEGREIGEVLRIVQEDSAAAVENPLYHVLRVGVVVGTPSRTALLRKDGMKISIDYSGAPLCDTAGQVHGAVLIFRNSTEHRRMEQSLRRTIERVGLLCEVASELLMAEQPRQVIEALCHKIMAHLDCHVFLSFLVDETQKRLHLNAYAGIPPEATQSIEWLDIATTVCGLAVQEQRPMIIENLPESSDPRVQHVRPFGVKVYACQPLVNEGQAVGTISFGSRTKLHFTADELSLMKAVGDEIALAVQRVRLLELAERRAAEAKAANEAKSRFLANVSHELRTPMNAILGMIELALPKQTDAAAQDFLKTAKESADLLLVLLNDLLDSAKIEAGSLKLEAAPMSLRRIFDQITRTLSMRASEKGLAFDCRLPEDLPDAVIGDKVRLRQVLLNLAGNAIKFSLRGEVVVSARVMSLAGDEALLEFSVQDTGIGIPADDLERIFSPFAQADASTARRFGGTGLGLSISKNLVELMGGRIWAESVPGEGSSFHFTVRLPLARETPAEQESSFALPAAPPAALRILLVEDNLANQKLAAYFLKQRGHVVEIAADGHQALRLTAEQQFDVILMDVQMPGMDGLQATAAIRAREAAATRVPIIAMTAHAAAGDRERCLAQGMDGYLAKPIDSREMIHLVEGLACGATLRLAPSSSEPSRGPSGVVFDRDVALKRCSDSQPVLTKMMRCFLNEVPVVLPQLETACAAGDVPEMSRLAHRLKGTLVYLGAEPATNAAIAIEELPTDCDRAVAQTALAALNRECAALAAALAGHVDAVCSAGELVKT